MTSVLLMVGRGEEAPSIVATLLDTARTPRKPQYCMASGGPLAGAVPWCGDKQARTGMVCGLEGRCMHNSLRTAATATGGCRL